MNSKKQSDSEKQFDILLYGAMKHTGWIIPQTIEEVFKAEEALEKESVVLPAEIADPYKLFNRKKQGKIKTILFKGNDSNVASELSQAAREGGEISDIVRQRMKNDRLAAEEKNNDE